jgi:hypothetical protein
LELGQRFGLPYTNHYTHVEVFLNGTYQGSYVLTEQMQVGKGRVDIDEKEGFFVEVDSYYDEDPKFRTDFFDLPVMIKSPEDVPFPEGYAFVINSLNKLDSLMFDDSFPDNGYRDLIDMETLVDFLMVNEIVTNRELMWPKSMYMYKDKGNDAKINMGPLWDFDWAFGYNADEQTYFTRSKSRTFEGWHAFLYRFFRDPVFVAAYKKRWNEMYADIADMEAFMDEMAASLEKSRAENFKLWGGNSDDYNQLIESMKAWWRERIAYLNVEINKTGGAK